MGKGETMQAFKNLIAGEWVNAAGGETFENRNPAKTDEVIGTFPSATAEDVKKAIAAA
ncbi:MAG: aldehyde dehydrogenase family protein, partial [Caldilineaceae bacterium]|nr:aldehyde dehydrogenase family protein [Caldilineaceae bacterium]